MPQNEESLEIHTGGYEDIYAKKDPTDTSPYPRFPDRREIIKSEVEVEKEVAHTTETWGQKHSGSIEYSFHFDMLLKSLQGSGYSFSDAVREAIRTYEPNLLKVIADDKIKRHGPIQVLDLMSYGYAHKTLNAAGCAVGLENSNIRNNLVRYIKGNIVLAHTWREIERYMAETGTNYFDFILSRPYGATSAIPDEVVGVLFERAYPLLSPNEGVLLTSVPLGLRPQIEASMLAINAADGLHMEYQPKESGILMVKTEKAPTKIRVLT